MKGHGNSEDDSEKSAAVLRHGPQGGLRRRRRTLLIAGSVSAVVLALSVVTLISRSHRRRRPSAIAEAASTSSPEIAALLREADDVANRLLERFPDSQEAVNVMARLHYRVGKTEEAFKWWQACVELDPGYTEAYSAMGAIAQENGDFAQAVDLCGKAAELDPRSSSIPVHLAESLMRLGKPEEAVQVLEKNLDNHPKSMASLALLGSAYVRLKEYEKARQYLEEAIEMAPDYTNAYYGLVTACAKLADNEKSKEYLEKFKALKARDEQAHRDQLKALDDLARIRSHLAYVYAAAGKVYLANGDFGTGEEYLLKATELAPDEAECRTVLAWLYEQQGRTDEALATLADVGKRASDDLGAQMSIASAYARLERFEEAESAYRKAIELTPHQAGGYAALAELCLQTGGKLPEAKVLALKAVDLEPVARYYHTLSLACLGNGDLAGAHSAILQAIASEPDNSDYQRTRQWIEEKLR